MRHQHYIAGQWRASESGRVEPIINPATEDVLAQVAWGDSADVDAAVSAATKATLVWSRTSGRQRADYLRAIALGVARERDNLARLQTANNGKPIAESRVDVDDVIATFDYYAGLAQDLDAGQDNPVALPNAAFEASLRYEPCGVVALIVPWNFPMVTTAWKLAPALAAGCCVVLKPSEITPLPELALAEVIDSVGLRAGVFNLVVGGGAEVGAAMVAHPGVRKVSFTGSTAIGRVVMKSAADDIKNVSLELGGKSAALVFADADIERALDIVCQGIFYNAGQMCSATSRLLVERTVADDFIRGLKRRAEAIVVGDPMDGRTTMGPLTTRQQYRKVLKYIEQGVAAGLHRVTGGRPVGSTKGFYLAPTIFADVPVDSPLWREEIFGPVLCVNTFESEQEAISMANQSEFGLVATVLTGDKERADRVSAALDVGLVWVNSPQVIFPQTSWGGMKKSGIGRELGPWGMRAFQEIKHVVRCIG